MDTRFWGPSGWKLFHLIAEDYTPTEENARVYADFFQTLPFVLPCKFCRSSLTDYYKAHPYATEERGTPAVMRPGLNVPKWMYTIHNCVNGKLRSQGLPPMTANPPYSAVKKRYEQMAAQPWHQQMAHAWDFLFSVGYHHPREKNLYAEPMPDCPSDVKHCKDAKEKNKWNVLPMKERLHWFHRFWTLLPVILPHTLQEPWKHALHRHPPTLASRASTVEWLWKMRCALDKGYQDPYTAVCKRIATYSSDCATQRGAFTCRKKTRRRRQTRKSHRNKTIKKQ